MSIRIIHGDCRDVLLTLPSDSVDCIVTSPPYWGLRDYGVVGQIGLEPTLADYLEIMAGVCRELRRVLKPTGTFWLNVGDSYAGAPGGFQGKNGQRSMRTFTARIDMPKRGGGMKPKDLCMVPNRLAIALQDDGWYVRSEIIWSKPNPMPESITDRPTSAHENADHPYQAAHPRLVQVGGIIGQHRLGIAGDDVKPRGRTGNLGQLPDDVHEMADIVAGAHAGLLVGHPAPRWGHHQDIAEGVGGQQLAKLDRLGVMVGMLRPYHRGDVGAVRLEGVGQLCGQQICGQQIWRRQIRGARCADRRPAARSRSLGLGQTLLAPLDGQQPVVERALSCPVSDTPVPSRRPVTSSRTLPSSSSTSRSTSTVAAVTPVNLAKQ